MSLMDIFRAVDLSGKLENWYNDPDIEQRATSHNLEGMTPVPKNNPKFTWPTMQYMKVTSPFGWRYLTIDRQKKRRFHIGTDFAHSREPCCAVEDMEIRKILKVDTQYPVKFKWTPNGWKRLKIPKNRGWTPYVKAVGLHTKTWYSYKHIKPLPKMKLCDIIKCGEPVGHDGNFGYSMGPHLHFECWPYSEFMVDTQAYGATHWPEPVDPVKYLTEKLNANQRSG